MKVGDVIRLQNLHEDWGTFALITGIHITDWGTGQIYVIANGMNSAIPYCSHEKYIIDVITERSENTY